MTSIFRTQKTVDPQSGKTILSVTANGVACDTFVLNGPIAKRYVGISLIHQDLKDALWWIRNAYSLLPPKTKCDDQRNIGTKHTISPDKDTFKTLKAYFYSSIVTYAKCFVSTDERGTKLEARDHIEKRYLPCHERIMNYRHSLVAHAGGAFDSGEVVVAPNPNGPEFHVAPNLWRLDYEDDREVAIGFEDLILHVKEKVEGIQAEILQKLLTQEARDAVIQHNSIKDSDLGDKAGKSLSAHQ